MRVSSGKEAGAAGLQLVCNSVVGRSDLQERLWPRLMLPGRLQYAPAPRLAQLTPLL